MSYVYVGILRIFHNRENINILNIREPILCRVNVWLLICAAPAWLLLRCKNVR